MRIDKESKEKLSQNVKNGILSKVKEIISDFDAVLISDYGKGVISREIIELAINAGKPVFVDPKPSNFSLYKGITIMTPNRKEAYESIKAEKTEKIENVGKKIMKELGLNQLLITLGGEGMALFEDEKVTKIPAKAKKVFDVTGAGDTVISVLAVSKTAGASWEEAATLANYAGGWVVGEIGTVAIDSETLLSLIP